ncbi:MAG: hypothetical protein RUDDFDWM_000331 [Candidatus Fervidibacterota bacterium]
MERQNEQAGKNTGMQHTPQKGITLQDVKRWTLIGLIVLLVILVMSFLITNWEVAEITLLPFTQPIHTPIGIALIISFALGWVIGAGSMLLRHRRT